MSDITLADAAGFARLACEVAKVGHWRLEVATEQIAWSEQMFRMFDLAVGDAPTLETVMDMIHPDDRQREHELLHRAIATGEGFSTTTRVLWPNGELRYLEGRTICERDAQGGVVAAFGALVDVTDQVRARDELARREGDFRLLADNIADVVIRVNARDEILYVSPSCRRYGYEPAELLGRSGYELVHAEDRVQLKRLIADLFRGGPVDPSANRRYRVRVKDGSWIWMEGNPSIVRDAGGRPLEVVSLLRDVSERIASEHALAASEARFRAITESVTDIVTRTHLNGRHLYMSPSTSSVLGYTPEEAMAMRPSESTHPDDFERLRAFWRAAIQGEPDRDRRCRFRTRHKSGGWVWLETNPTVLHGPDGAPTEVADVFRDVSAQVRLETQLVAARDAAVAAAKVKAEFMANMSHEIRTPLTAILGFTDLLERRDDLSDAARRQIDRIAGAGQSLLAIVNDILDFSKLEAGEMTIKPRPTRLAEVLSQSLELFQPQASAKGLDLRLEAGELPPVVSIDPEKVRQVLVNLLGNAVKFTAAGGVTLCARYDLCAGRLRMEVRDTGAGMTREEQARLFQRFSQIDGSTTRKHGGTGLGLAISRALVEAMGGRIDVRSKPAAGSVFRFSIAAPVAEGAEAPEPSLMTASLDLRVLVADDNPANRELASAFLGALGAEVTEAEDGAAAVERALALPFDVILMDVRMPGLDGPSATRRIRQTPGPNQSVPILAFTADVQVELGEDIRLFDGVVRKPIVPAELVGALARCAEPARAAPPPEAAGPAKSPRARRSDGVASA